MNEEKIEIPNHNEKMTLGEIKKYLFEEIKKEILAERFPPKVFRLKNKQKQKFEKIEKMAWELSKIFLPLKVNVKGKELKTPDDMMAWCWACAESFCKLAKQKKQKQSHD